MVSMVLLGITLRAGVDNPALDRRVFEDKGQYYACETPVLVTQGHISAVGWGAFEQAAILVRAKGRLESWHWVPSVRKLDGRGNFPLPSGSQVFLTNGGQTTFAVLDGLVSIASPGMVRALGEVQAESNMVFSLNHGALAAMSKDGKTLCIQRSGHAPD